MSEYIITGEQLKRLGVPDMFTEQEIVRCSDCKYNAKDTDGICYRFDHEHLNQPDGFCKWAERRNA